MKRGELRQIGIIVVVIAAIALLLFAVKRSQDIRSNAGLHFGGSVNGD